MPTTRPKHMPSGERPDRHTAQRQHLCAAVAVCIFLGGIVPAQASQQALEGSSSLPTLWFDRPAQDWERESLPIGNGAMGAAVQGGIAVDHLQFNEKTLWTGGPGSEGYDFGLPREPQTKALEQVRETLAREGALSPKAVAAELGREVTAYGNYQSFGELLLQFPQKEEEASDYRRELDIANAVARVSYRSGDTNYTREYFASYPDRVIAVHLRADRKGKISFKASLRLPDNRSAELTTADGRITASGQLHDNGLHYETQLRVIAEGGKVSRNGNGISVTGADSATLLLAAGTDYASDYPHYRGPNPHRMVEAGIGRASRKGYPALLADHIADHRALFDRVQLNLSSAGAAPLGTPSSSSASGPQARPSRPTAAPTQEPIDQWLENYGSGDEAADRALEALYFQYGRYLLISSSRDGSLPANLQGVWNNSATPPWNADYHVNINLQMNYWPAEVTNLAETTGPLFDFIDSLREPGELAAEKLLDARGWTLFLNTNIWGFSGVIAWPTAFWQPEAGAWLAQHYYEHYLFSGDLDFLRERAYPAMKGAAQVWLDTLIPDPRDGLLMVSPSYSPEHGDFTVGAAMSQQIVFDLLSNTRDAAELLGDAAFARQLDDTLEKLDPGLRIGSWGQLQEWKADLDDPENHHRHVSHLFALYPGDQIAPTPELVKAARTSLEARGDAGTGWSRAWKVALWARLADGDRAHRILAAQLSESTLPNLWSTHPPFQIDGNFGATAGVAEMLLQSHAGEIHLLPALPQAWRNGSVTGLRARGDATVNMQWRDGKLLRARIHSGRSGEIRLRLPAGGKFIVRREADNKVLSPQGEGEVNTFTAQAGETYLLENGEVPQQPAGSKAAGR
ncbi:glycoside hydrolase family 95 protein [Microbulbifer sp. RZ01]|uniref:glycoside hydrolase family 95 protein n=2 Tax=unclassified Microbulbifer TaxID=2619833 RepID=UPI0027E4547E|nr:glycoside hydrolase family 95 protein [Microbulbifer sp. RZ01]